MQFGVVGKAPGGVAQVRFQGVPILQRGVGADLHGEGQGTGWLEAVRFFEGGAGAFEIAGGGLRHAETVMDAGAIRSQTGGLAHLLDGFRELVRRQGGLGGTVEVADLGHALLRGQVGGRALRCLNGERYREGADERGGARKAHSVSFGRGKCGEHACASLPLHGPLTHVRGSE